MKKNILLLSFISITWASLEACTFTVLNNSPYEEIFISNKEHMAPRVSRETLRKEALSAGKPSKQKNKDAKKSTEKVVRISKVMKKDPRGQIIGTWFDIYVPYYEHQKPSRKLNATAGKFKKAYRVAIRSCGKDNDIKYSNVVHGYATEEDKHRENPRYDIVDFSKPEQAARAHELITEHDEMMNESVKKNKNKARAAMNKKRKKKFVDQFESEHLDASKKLRKKDAQFYEETTYPGDNPEKFEGNLP